jgi:tRNA-modifying protein YgfZ
MIPAIYPGFMTDHVVEDQARQLASGEAFTDLGHWRKVEVTGADAGAWLQDLVSADVDGLEVGASTLSLLLSPTGRVRAAFTVARTRDGSWLLLQDPSQDRAAATLLAPYVLSSDVTLQDRTEALCLFALPGRGHVVDVPGGATLLVPSCLGVGGFDMVAPVEERERVTAALEARLVNVGPDTAEAWRIAAGIPRFGVDATEEDLPAEAGLDGAVAFHKGCYLGQEAVAKVRNLGHPRRLVLSLEAAGTVSPGEAVLSGGDHVGAVTSATSVGGRTVLFARVRWDARDHPITTAGGVSLEPRQASSPV